MEKIIIGMNKIIINKNTYLIPASWREMQSRKLLKIAPLLLGDGDTLAIRKAMVLFNFLPSIKRYWVHHSWVTYLINKFPALKNTYPLFTGGQKWDLLRSIDFLFNDLSGAAILKQFDHNGTTYYLPGDNFTRESIIAFAFADEYFNRYIETNNEKYINLLIGCIARQQGSKLYPALQFTEGDHREHFSTARTDQRAKEFQTLPKNIKTAIILFFMGSKKYIATHYEILFRKKKEEQEKGEVEPKKKMQGFGKKKVPKPNFNWIGVIYELSETGVFGNFDQVKNMFIHTCCYYLSKKRYEAEEQTA